MGKMNLKSLCATCMNCSQRTVETHMDLHDYKRKGQAYDYEYACQVGFEIWGHQVTAKCDSYCIEGRAT
jgi:hypothetical protein